MPDEEKLLPKPELDLPLPEKELSEHLASQGDALRSYGKQSIFRNKIFILFIALSFLIAFLIGGFALGRNSVLKELNPTIPAIPSPDPVIYDPTKNWKIYEGDGFNFKYPSASTVDELANQTNMITGNKTNSVQIASASKEFTLNIYSENNTGNLSANDFLEKYKSRIEKQTNPNDQSGQFVIDKVNNSTSIYQNGEINGVGATLGFDYDYGTIIATDNGKVYVFQYFGGQGQKISTEDEQILKNILSTFKFTDAKLSCVPRPSCFDSKPRCLIPETEDMCPPSPIPSN